MKNKTKSRRETGLSITVLLTFIAFFVIGPMSMFVYELSRYNLASQQLKYCADSAALTAAASTTGANSADMTVVMTTAMNQAAWMFSQNSILDQPLLSTPMYTYGTSTPTMTPAANKAQLYFQFLDPVTKTPVAYGSANGKILQVTAAFGYQPVTSNFTHIAPGPYVIVQQSDGGLPQLDVVLCFDISASMDDFTNITLVNRYSPNAVVTSTNVYSLATPMSNVTTTNGVTYTTVQGPLYYAVNCTQPTGTGFNATWPINLSDAIDSASFSLQNHGTNHGARPPTYLGAKGLSLPNTFTDMVVNVDGTQNMTKGVSITVNGNVFTFPAGDPTGMPYGILCEAQRGNLEDPVTAALAGIDTSAAGFKKYPGFAFQAGWFQAYYTLAMQIPSIANTTASTIPIRRPIGDAIMAARTFFSVLNNNADVHFGLVTFSDVAGQQPTSQVIEKPQPSSIMSGVATGGYPVYDPPIPPNPGILLNPTPGSAYSNYDTSATPSPTSVDGCVYYNNSDATHFGIQTLLACGGTNIADGLDYALAMQLGTHPSDPSSTSYGQLKLSRPSSTRAIVLFTDGLPTAGGDDGSKTPPTWTNSQKEAGIAKKAGIPIYTIGLALVASLQATQTMVLTDAPGSNGIAALSGNNSTFAQTTDATQLTAIFQNVARQLVQLVRTQN